MKTLEKKKNEQAELVEKLPPSYLPFRYLHNLHSFLLWEKVKKKLCIVSYDKWFGMKSWQKFANLLLLCKAPIIIIIKEKKTKKKTTTTKKKKKKKKKTVLTDAENTVDEWLKCRPRPDVIFYCICSGSILFAQF